MALYSYSSKLINNSSLFQRIMLLSNPVIVDLNNTMTKTNRKYKILPFSLNIACAFVYTPNCMLYIH